MTLSYLFSSVSQLGKKRFTMPFPGPSTWDSPIEDDAFKYSFKPGLLPYNLIKHLNPIPKVKKDSKKGL